MPKMGQVTPGDVNAAIAAHAADPDAHHDKYTNAEAVTAMGAKADDNPLHHDKAEEWGATEHTAIGNNAPHHARYTDAETAAVADAAIAVHAALPTVHQDAPALIATHKADPSAHHTNLA